MIKWVAHWMAIAAVFAIISAIFLCALDVIAAIFTMNYHGLIQKLTIIAACLAFIFLTLGLGLIAFWRLYND